ncbi:MAG: 4-alpha-glucanotransferase [Bryobacteraceae bacterium]
MKFPRAGGILLHPTSLPGRFGIGDFGPEAERFLDWLREAGQHIWQVLPLGPTGYGDSPYQCFSAFAGNPLLISPDKLADHGYISRRELADAPASLDDRVEFETVIPFKLDLLRRAFRGFSQTAEYRAFEEEHRAWLDPFAHFMALKRANGEVAWTEWDRSKHASEDEIALQKWMQFEFFRQWNGLKRKCREHGIRVMGDIPIYVAHDSADVWARPELWDLDADGRARTVAGVPPDYFSATGQLWGNPIYRWDRIAEDGYAWWIERFRATLDVVDMMRLDHFRGFEAYWEVPGTEPTAMHGRWVKGPGVALFEAAEKALGELPIVAENLGVITPEVEAIRHQFHYPGMSILQFAFGNDPQAPTFRPHNYPREVVAYTGTHDNDTTIGWWTSIGAGDSTRTPDQIEKERAQTRAYLNTDGREIHWAFIRTIIASVADTALVPMQDVLGLGSEARMNLPGSTKNHWRWRCKASDFREEHAARLLEYAKLYDR